MAWTATTTCASFVTGRRPPTSRAHGRRGWRIYGQVCGWTLARAHARSGDRVAIGAYLGKKDVFENAIADFASTYADQNEKDHALLRAAIDSGRVEATEGV